MSNHLMNQTSPYLLQHAGNPVDWYPWSKEAFDKAEAEDKPIFLSIGYSTCHWCHVMAHESFEDKEVADILNRYFISIKVDKEQRPDIDSVYMAVCQAFTGSGGWPTSIFMTAEQKPFFAGTYFPKNSRYGIIGFKDLLLAILEKWQKDRDALLNSANEIAERFHQRTEISASADEKIINDAMAIYQKSHDEKAGGFGGAPKFPTPHNLLFLMQQYEKSGNKQALKMAEKTLVHMYRGGLFDHIGFGFCRYSTDRYFLVPHFEKMLYDNALLMAAYCKAYEVTKTPFYRDVAEKIAFYVLTEMTSEYGGFYSAQDADSDGVEGKYYVFEPQEIITLLGAKEGGDFNRYFNITSTGNFEGKSIPNLLHAEILTDSFNAQLPNIRDYRRKRCGLHTDDKILTAWNSLMIAALCALYRISKDEKYIYAAKKAQSFIEDKLFENDHLYVSFRNGKRGERGFLDDYAFYTYALLNLYGATLENDFLVRATQMVDKAVSEFFDHENGGFYLYGKGNESLIFRPKESYDGAMPSGNSVMTHNLVRLQFLIPNEKAEQLLQKQLDFMYGEAEGYPAGYAMFLLALSDYFNSPKKVTVVIKNKADADDLPFILPSDVVIRLLEHPTEEYKLVNDQTTYYVCKNHSCLPPVNRFDFYEQNKGNTI